MTSLFEREVGEEWQTLHPRVRDRYGLEAGEGREAVGVGRMHTLTRTPLAVPVLWLSTLDDFLFPERGTDVPFTITSRAFVDDNGNEALFLHRRFETSPPRTFVDTLRWNPARECITDLFGRHGLVAADLHISAGDASGATRPASERSDGGALALSIGAQWVRLGDRYLGLPGPVSAEGRLRDWYDEDDGRFRVAAEITTPVLGAVFGYEGTFENEFRAADTGAPSQPSLGGVALPGEIA